MPGMKGIQHDLVACRHGHSLCPFPQRAHLFTPSLSAARLSRVQPSPVRCTERSGQMLPFWPEHSKHSLALHAGRMGRTKQRGCRASALSAIQHSDLAIWTVLSACAAASQVIQVRTKLGSTVGSPILAIIAGLVCSMAGLLPIQSGVYDTIWQSIMPLAAALFLLEADLRGLFSSARDTTVAFVLASVGTLVGTAVAWMALSQRLGAGGWQLAAALTASYIGGSINFAAVSASLATPGPLVAAAMAADNIAMACYLAIISFCPAENVPLRTAANPAALRDAGVKAAVSSESMAMSLAAAMLACCAGLLLDRLILAGSGLGFAALSASAMASVAGMWTAKQGQPANTFAGAEALGGTLMLLFFVTIGAAAGSPGSLLNCGWLAVFMSVQLAVHLLVVLGVGKLAGIPMQALLTASNAAIGGPGTAAAMASSRGWTSQVTPALLTGSLGYSVGTPIGLAVGAFLQHM
ncbi:hypothetical protein CVIRNUC_003046 [Coccomyxa viridis]|uniref:DUF819 family protein n=1 Tax=Coccomyxa viridis TaxID=1274662 RepID=A0AAV1HYZ3_9CHLO|nr:hypothetical protein CVIRNUC_003046 [Coccomyxa viridis]